MVRRSHDLEETVRLVFADRSSFRDADDIADASLPIFVVRLESMRSPHALFVQRMLNDVFNGHDDGLMHLVAHDRAGLGLELTGHLCLLSTFGQDRRDASDLTFRLAQSGRVFCLSRRQSKAQSDQIVFRFLQATFQFWFVELTQLA
jgi:hypothetical protein